MTQPAARDRLRSVGGMAREQAFCALDILGVLDAEQHRAQVLLQQARAALDDRAAALQRRAIHKVRNGVRARAAGAQVAGELQRDTGWDCECSACCQTPGMRISNSRPNSPPTESQSVGLVPHPRYPDRSLRRSIHNCLLENGRIAPAVERNKYAHYVGLRAVSGSR